MIHILHYNKKYTKHYIIHKNTNGNSAPGGGGVDPGLKPSHDMIINN